MTGKSKKILQSSLGVALATLLSRALGLFRVILEARYLGGGIFASSWQLAFMAPNLFRRLLGEGALGSALVPLISHKLENNGRAVARRQLTIIFVALGIILVVICVIISGLALLFSPMVTSPYWHNALCLIPLLMPYAFFICMVGVAGSVLNSLRIFFLPALGALLLNISLISCLLLLAPGLINDINTLLRSLACAVLLAGAAQFVLMLLLLWRYDLFPVLTNAFKECAIIGELWKLTLPGLIGASALQISFLVDRLLASCLGPQAVPALTYTDRIIFVPVSVFGLALGTVLLANMSRAAAKNDISGMASSLELGLRHIFYICVPIALFIAIFREPIFRMIYLRGQFTLSDLQETIWAALFYASGIPFFAAIKITVSAFYSRKDMKTPLKVSLLCIAVNIVLNLLLMFPLRQGGIALATVVSSMLNNLILLYILRRTTNIDFQVKPIVSAVMKSAACSGALAAGLFFCYPVLLRNIPRTTFLPQDLLPLAVIGATFCSAYVLTMLMTGSKESSELLSIFKRN